MIKYKMLHFYIYSVVLFLIIFFNTQVIGSECFEEDAKANELNKFILGKYVIEIANSPLQTFECAEDQDYFRVYENNNQIFELDRVNYLDTFDYKARLVENYKDSQLNEVWMSSLLKKLKTIEGENWRYFIATSWRGNCGGCMALHQISISDEFTYHGRIYLYPQTNYSLPSIKKFDANGKVIYDEIVKPNEDQ